MIRFDDVSFHYGGERGTGEGVDHINLTVHDGECVVLCGRSGCGKTTVTRLANGLAPHFFEGELEGSVHVGDYNVSEQDLAGTAALVGSVFQNPKSQFFNVDTTGELAFGCENLGLPREKIRERVRRASDDLKLEALLDRNIFELSGGEKQQIACGSVYATDPEVYVLDEPSSNLDRGAMRRLHDALARMKSAGKSILISEHRLHFLMDLADRFVYMDDGIITHEFTSAELAGLGDAELSRLGLRTCSLDSLGRAATNDVPGDTAQPALEALDLACMRGGTQILDIDRLALPRGSIVALIGDNGSGKSTLSEVLCGVMPANGAVGLMGTFLSEKARSARSFLVMQDVNRQLFSDTVMEEVMLNSGVTRERADAVLGRLDLLGCADRHPASLSGGQKQRVAIASAICAGKDILFYDEPTSGLDRGGMERFGGLLREVRDDVALQVIVTHDPELIMRACTHVLRVDNGRITGFYPLDAEGERRVRYYFTSAADDNTSRRRTKTTPVGKILSYTGGEKWKTFAAAAIMTVAALLSVVPYLVVWRLIDQVVAGDVPTLAQAAVPIGVILACLVLNAVLYMSGLQLSHRAAFKTLENIRCSLQERLEAQPLGNVQDMGTGEVKKLFVDDTESIELLLAHLIPEGVANVVAPAIVLLVMAAIDWRLCLLTLVVVAFGASASGQLFAVGMDRMGSYFAATKRLNNTIIEYVNGMEVVRVFNCGADATEKFEGAVRGYRDFALAWYEVSWPWMAAYGSLFLTTTLYTLPYGALLVVLGGLSLSRWVLVLCLALGIGPLLSHVMGFASSIPQTSYKIQSLEKALDRMPLKVGEGGFEGACRDITFEDVHFGYGNDEVLKGVSFVAREGQMTALVGPSGSGKSTIAKLIAHYYDVESGHVRIGGQDVRDITLESLADQVAYVSQEQFLFNKSILENIRIGRTQATDEEVRDAARRARCDEFVSQLPQGYDTPAGAAGGMLSGGQRQRIAFARAILKDAPVIVLDEATAHIDPENAEKMGAAIAELTRDKTVVVIAHRLASVVGADKICVVEGGRIVAEGTHEDLLASCETYRTLWAASEGARSWSLKGGDGAC